MCELRFGNDEIDFECADREIVGAFAAQAAPRLKTKAVACRAGCGENVKSQTGNWESEIPKAGDSALGSAWTLLAAFVRP